ncbi:MAG: hypothetical protein IT377_07845, partial [Polyangiaceae bacterium]|nr:hypothetical protein [Polyangiaceae bacterium]
MRNTTKEDPRARRTARAARQAASALALLAPLWLIASACGSDSGGDDSSSGPCQQGDTRACLGPGQCNGAQG